jgi:hypothetical protein
METTVAAGTPERSPATAGAVLLKLKKEITPEQRAAETRKRAACREAARARVAKTKAAVARVQEAELVHATQAPAQAVIMLKEEALTLFSIAKGVSLPSPLR